MQIAKFAVVILFLSACSPGDREHKPLFTDEAQPASVKGAPSYAEVRPVFEQNCAVCHPSRSAPNWLDFNQAHSFARNGLLERRVFIERSMPPPGSPQAAAISESQRSLLATWARAGGPLEAVTGTPGEPAETPSPLQTMALQQQCFQCHGQGGLGNPAQPSVPRLAGQNEIYLAAQMESFKWRERRDPSNAMNDVAANLSPKQVAEMAAFFTKAEPPPPPAKITLESRQTLFERGKALAADNCIACHMNPDFNNKSNVPEVPLLTNQSEVYLRNQLLYFRNGERSNEVMNQIAKDLSNDDIAALALYFAQSH